MSCTYLVGVAHISVCPEEGKVYKPDQMETTLLLELQLENG